MTNRIKQRIEELEIKTKPKSGIAYYRASTETIEDAKRRFRENYGREMADGDTLVCYQGIDPKMETVL